MPVHGYAIASGSHRDWQLQVLVSWPVQMVMLPVVLRCIGMDPQTLLGSKPSSPCHRILAPLGNNAILGRYFCRTVSAASCMRLETAARCWLATHAALWQRVLMGC